jgi:hypothetical protein
LDRPWKSAAFVGFTHTATERVREGWPTDTVLLNGPGLADSTLALDANIVDNVFMSKNKRYREGMALATLGTPYDLHFIFTITTMLVPGVSLLKSTSQTIRQ